MPPAATSNSSGARWYLAGTRSGGTGVVSSPDIGTTAVVNVTWYVPGITPSGPPPRPCKTKWPLASVNPENMVGSLILAPTGENMTCASGSGFPSSVTVPSTGTNPRPLQPAPAVMTKASNTAIQIFPVSILPYKPVTSLSPAAMLPIAAYTYKSISYGIQSPEPSQRTELNPPG